VTVAAILCLTGTCQINKTEKCLYMMFFFVVSCPIGTWRFNVAALHAFAFSTKLKNIKLNKQQICYLFKMAFKFPIGGAKWQAWLDQAEREMQELMQLQNPPPCKDVATQTYTFNAAQEETETGRGLKCTWLTFDEVSMTIEFMDEYDFNWERRHPHTHFSHRHTIINCIVRLIKTKTSKVRDFLTKTFGDTMRITRGLHMSPNAVPNMRQYQHFNALDINDNTYHVYCKPGHGQCVHIVAFTMIATTTFPDTD
jgi:hypothetical protein